MSNPLGSTAPVTADNKHKYKFWQRLIITLFLVLGGSGILTLVANTPNAQEVFEAGGGFFEGVKVGLLGKKKDKSITLTSGIPVIVHIGKENYPAKYFSDPINADDGWGYLEYENGDVYYGQLEVNGEECTINGFGIYWLAKTNEMHLGPRVKGLAEGPGIRIQNDQARYYSAVYRGGNGGGIKDENGIRTGGTIVAYKLDKGKPIP